jgi:hypothetical protein
VAYEADVVEVCVGGTLIGSYAPNDKLARNVVLVGLSQDPRMKKGKLAEAFALGPERLRVLNREVENRGLAAICKRIETRGRKTIVTPVARKKLYKLFDAGASVRDAFEEYGKKSGLGRSTVGTVRKTWSAQRRPVPVQLALKTEKHDHDQREQEQEQEQAAAGRPQEAAEHNTDCEGCSTLHPGTRKNVQHAGGWLLIAAAHALGLYSAIQSRCQGGRRIAERMRLAVDAVLIALGLGLRCVEGVRRLQTPTADVLLRCRVAPSESWTRRVLKEYADDAQAFWVHTEMMQTYLGRDPQNDGGPAVFYVDNHMRPYTGKHALRKGWRMQDKRAAWGQ